MSFHSVPAEENESSVLRVTELERNLEHTTAKLRNYGDTTYQGSLPNSPLKSSKSTKPVYQDANKWFAAVEAKHSGKINARELQQAFQTFQGRHFTDSSCKFVVRLFDLDKNGGLDVREFEQLFFYVKQWANAFNAFDREKCGFISEKNFDSALQQMNIHFSPEFIRFLINKNDPVHKQISLEQFIVTCIQIQKYADEFKSRDKGGTGEITIKYEDFLEMTLRCL